MMRNSIFREIIVIISLGIIFILWWGCSEYRVNIQNRRVVINEVCNNNFSTIPLRWHEDDDWIELYNGTEEDIDLEGWTISDNEVDIRRYDFPQTILKAGDYLLLFANGEDNVTDNGIFLNFKLSQGENVYLYDAAGRMVDSVTVPDMKTNASHARIPDGSDRWLEVYPTLQASNNSSIPVQQKEVSPPIFSKEGGFYKGSTLLEMTVLDEDTNIYYTLDGSIPTTESMWYSEPLLIENRSGEPNNFSVISGITYNKWYQSTPQELVD